MIRHRSGRSVGGRGEGSHSHSSGAARELLLGCRGRWQPGLGLAEEAMSSRCFLDVFRRKLPKDLGTV